MLTRTMALICWVVAAASLGGGAAVAQLVRTHEVDNLRGFHGAGLGKRVTRSFQSDSEARAEFSRILSSVGLSWITDRIELRANAQTANAEAGIEQGKRFIFYNALFMQKVKARTADHWSLVSILAHEVGHHLAFHTEVTGRWHEFELEADYFSGFVLRRLNANLDEALKAMRDICQKEATKTHPGCDDRLQAITLGWTEGGQGGAPKGFKTALQQTPPTPPAAPPAARSLPTAAASDPSKPAYLEMFRGCVREREHFRKDRILASLKRRFSARPHQYGWLPETIAQRRRVGVTDPDLSWHAITKAEINNGLLELDYAWRNGKLRLVPVLSKSWGTRSVADVAIGLQGLWVTDNSFGCIEVRLDDAGVGRGMWGVHENVKLDSPVFLRPAPKAAVVTQPPAPVVAAPEACPGIRAEVVGKGQVCLDPANPAKRAFQDCRGGVCGPTMVALPTGSFLMGSPQTEQVRDDDEDDTPGKGGKQRKVTIARPFAVAKFEVTLAQFKAFVADTKYKTDGGCFAWTGTEWKQQADRSWRNPGFPQADTHPVTCVNWDDAKAYVSWLEKTTGQPYRLLSEAEWEYAARAGTTTPFSFGATISTDQANYDGNYTSGVGKKGKYRKKTIEVGSLNKPNDFGLHDMRGNVWEWVADCYADSYKSAPTDGSKAPDTKDCSRVLRGGSWIDIPQNLRAAFRGGIQPGGRFTVNGFRLARTLNPTP